MLLEVIHSLFCLRSTLNKLMFTFSSHFQTTIFLSLTINSTTHAHATIPYATLETNLPNNINNITKTKSMQLCFHCCCFYQFHPWTWLDPWQWCFFTHDPPIILTVLKLFQPKPPLNLLMALIPIVPTRVRLLSTLLMTLALNNFYILKKSS